MIILETWALAFLTLLLAEIDPAEILKSPARKYFLEDRRPEIYPFL